MKNEVINFIIETLVKKYYVSADTTNENSVYEHLDLDSLAVVEITAMLEKEFKVKIPVGAITSDMTIAISADTVLRSLA